MLDKTRKLGQKIFSIERLPFFSKSCVFNNFLGVTEVLQLHKQCQNTSTTLKNCSQRFGIFDKRRKNRLKLLSPGT